MTIDAATVRKHFDSPKTCHRDQCVADYSSDEIADALEELERRRDDAVPYESLMEDSERVTARNYELLRILDELRAENERLEGRIAELEKGDVCPICKQRHWTESTCGGTAT